MFLILQLNETETGKFSKLKITTSVIGIWSVNNKNFSATNLFCKALFIIVVSTKG